TSPTPAWTTPSPIWATSAASRSAPLGLVVVTMLSPAVLQPVTAVLITLITRPAVPGLQCWVTTQPTGASPLLTTSSPVVASVTLLAFSTTTTSGAWLATRKTVAGPL